MKIQLLVGLGNPEQQYLTTRHNAGTWWLEEFCKSRNLSLKNNSKLQSKIVNLDSEVKCAIPNKYMNESGISVSKMCNYYQIPIENVLVIHDELDLDCGVAKFKFAGGHGGHNGLRNIIAHLGKDFYRLRIGIGHPGNKHQVVNYVLQSPSNSDKNLIDEAIQTSINVMPKVLSGNLPTAMQELHTRN